MSDLVSLAIGLVIGLGVAIVVGLAWRRRGGRGPSVNIHSTIEQMRSVGELVVYRLVTKEIVTAADHTFGEAGRRYLSWLVSEKKMAMIFQFGIDFRYNLRSGDFRIEHLGEGRYKLRLPACHYTTSILDISFYDEQNSRFLPALLPDLLNRALSSGFDETEKNRLKEEARQEADRLAQNMVESMQSDVQRSARQTLEAIARGFGAGDVEIEFAEHKPVLAQINISDKAEAQIEGTVQSQGT